MGDQVLGVPPSHSVGASGPRAWARSQRACRSRRASEWSCRRAYGGGDDGRPDRGPAGSWPGPGELFAPRGPSAVGNTLAGPLVRAAAGRGAGGRASQTAGHDSRGLRRTRVAIRREPSSSPSRRSGACCSGADGRRRLGTGLGHRPRRAAGFATGEIDGALLWAVPGSSSASPCSGRSASWPAARRRRHAVPHAGPQPPRGHPPVPPLPWSGTSATPGPAALQRQPDVEAAWGRSRRCRWLSEPSR